MNSPQLLDQDFIPIAIQLNALRFADLADVFFFLHVKNTKH